MYMKFVISIERLKWYDIVHSLLAESHNKFGCIISYTSKIKKLEITQFEVVLTHLPS